MMDKSAIKTKVEPLRQLIDRYGFDFSQIKTIATGLRYSAVMLKNGNIGVCANLGNTVMISKKKFEKPDLDNIQHRILVNAYFNALLNDADDNKRSGDIFDVINFGSYKTIVMVGLFRPIVKKFRDNGILLHVFDVVKNDPTLTPLEQQSACLKKADAVILSSTTVFNNTFLNILKEVQVACDVLMLGPSSIMTREMFEYKNVRSIFGSVFNKFDEDVLKIIQGGGGTKDFQPLGRKVYLGNVSDG